MRGRQKSQEVGYMKPTEFSVLHAACVKAQQELHRESLKTLDLFVLANNFPLNTERHTALSMQCEIELQAQLRLSKLRTQLLELTEAGTESSFQARATSRLIAGL